MGINLRRGDIGMSQEFLEFPEVHLAAVQQMGGYTVAQHVRRNVGLNPRPLGIAFQDKPEALPGKPLSPPIEE
jgi:hypothetical protein